MNIEELRALNKDLKNIDEYINYNEIDYMPKDGNWGCITLIIGACVVLIFLSILAECPGDTIFGCIMFCLSLCGLVYYFTVPQELNKELKVLKMCLDSHNEKFVRKHVNAWKDEQYKSFVTIDKKINIKDIKGLTKQIIIDDTSKTFNFLELRWSWNTYSNKLDTGKVFKSFKYSELLKYEVIDKTTSQQIATSITESKRGQALGGAVVGKLLFDEGAAGAIIGSNGERITNTTYETKYFYDYDVNIYLDRLNDSIFRINLPTKYKVSEVVAVLEYILKFNS